MRAHRLVVSLLALVMGAEIALAQAPDTTALVRLSYVQGQVSILQGETTQFDQAQAWNPIAWRAAGTEFRPAPAMFARECRR